MVLEREEGLNIEIIPIQTEDGISSLAFSFKNILQDYGEEIIEIAMDSTCANLHNTNVNKTLTIVKGKQTR